MFVCALGLAPGAARAVVISQSVVIHSQSVARQVVAPWRALTLSVTAVGAGTLSYQWRHDNRPISGAVDATYSVPQVRYADAGAYTVDVTDSGGTVTSTPMFVLVAPSRTELVAWGQSDAIAGDQTDLVAVSAGSNYAAAIHADGSVSSWGRSETIPADLKDAVAVAAGSNFSLALKSDGTVVAWGNPLSPCLSLPANLGGVVAIAAGADIAGAVRSDGSAVVWGANGLLQTWSPDATHHAQAVALNSVAPLILTTEGAVVPLQGAMPDRFADLAGIQDAVAFSSAGNHCEVLRHDGTVADVGNFYVIATGLIYTPISIPSGLSSVLGVAAGDVHSLALKSDGTVVAWGQQGVWAGDHYGQAIVPTALTQAIAVSAAGFTSLALRDGTGDIVPSIATEPADISVGRGEYVTFSVSATGGNAPVTYQWRHNGLNIAGATQMNLAVLADDSSIGSYDVVVTDWLGSTTSRSATLSVVNLATISSTGGARVVLKPGDPLSLGVTPKTQASISYQWYKDNRFLLGETQATLSRAAATYADAGVYSVRVSDGTASQYLNIFVAVAPTTTQILPIGDVGDDAKAAFCDSVTDAIAVSCGNSQILALRRDGTVVSSLGASSVPAGLNDVVALAPGGASRVMKSDGTIVSWDGGVVQTSYLGNLVSLEGLWPDGTLRATGGGAAFSASGIAAANSNPSHGLAVKADGTVVAWGPYTTGATLVPSGLTDCVAVAAGDYQSLALRSNGTVAAWGGYFYFNAYGGVSYGEGTVPAGLSNVTAIAAGNLNSLALRGDGSVVVWGRAKDEVYSNLTNVFSIAAGGNLLLTLRDATAGSLFGIRHYAPVGTLAGGWTGSFSVSVYDSAGVTYQWYKDGVAIPGATSARLQFVAAQASDVGSYQVAVTRGGVTWWSTAVTPTFYQGTPANPFGSLSSRCFVGTGDSVAVPAFVLVKPSIVLIRAAGPSLAQFGMSGLLAKPELTLFDASGKAILSNQGWKTAPTYRNGTAPDASGNFDTNFDVAQVAYAVGAFPYDSDQDAAIAVRLPAGLYTAQVSGADGGSGNALMEVYLYRPNAPFDLSLRFSALSTRCYVGQGDSVAVTGLNVEINSVVLLRAVGPTLGSFGVGKVLAKPKITVFDSKGAVVATNTGWRTNADSGALVSQESARLGEFALTSSDDSAMVISLPPGRYTVEVKGADGGSGNALIEAYFAANGLLDTP